MPFSQKPLRAISVFKGGLNNMGTFPECGLEMNPILRGARGGARVNNL